MKNKIRGRLKIWFLVTIVLTIVLMVVSNPLRRSESHIRSQLLVSAPLGTSLENVEQYILEEEWEINWVSKESGFNHQRFSPSRVIGSKSIRANLGDYQGIPFKANVTVFWGFDDQSKLIDIWVWKTWDGL